MANDLGTIGILVDVRGMPLVKELATTLNQTAAANDKVSNSAREVIRKLKEERAAMREVAAANTLAGASFSRLQLTTVAKNMDTLTSSTLRYNRAAQQSMQGANRFGMVSQQVGYQVGDFFVQVQSGTNALTAFGQQATQLAGLLPGLAGAIVGIGISLGTALGMAALRSQELTINFQKIGQDVLSALAPVQGLIDAIGTGLSYAGQAAAKGMELLIQNLDRIFTYGATIAALFAGKYVAGMVAATAATASLSGALLFLRGALIKTGIGALVVVAGELVYQFTRLVDAAGGFGKAIGLLSAVASEAWDRISLSASAMWANIESAWANGQATIYDGLQGATDAVVSWGNTTTGVFKGAFDAMKAVWGTLPAAIGDFTIQAANSVISGVESMLNAVVKRINTFITSLSDLLAKVPGMSDLSLGTLDEVDLGGIENKYAGAGAAAGKAAGEAFSKAMDQTYVESPNLFGGLANAARETAKGFDEAAVKLTDAANKPMTAWEKLTNVFNDTTKGAIDLSSWLTKTGEAAKGTTKAAEELRKELESPLVSAVGSISDAFGDFVARGLRDFKGFVKQILGSFQNMIAQMIAMAVKNRIMLSLGIGGLTPGMAAAGQIAGIGNAGGMLGSFAGGGVAGSGLLGGFGAAMPSFLGGAGNGLFAVGANAAAAGGTVAATIGAVAAPLLAVAAVFSFFKKKTKELDSGLRITVGNMDALVETFRTVQTTRFFGLSKKTTTTVGEAGAEISDPIIKAVQDIQTQVIKAAEVFGIAESGFADFVYKFDVSLKGLTDEQKLQKINEELLKMGDAFASLTGHFTSMNELLAAAQQRYDIQTRLLELQGNAEELLRRNREAELASVHELNRSLLLQVYALEDAQRALDNYNRAVANTASAAANLRSAMDRELSTAQANMDAARVQLEKAVQQRVATIQSGFAKVFASIEAQIDSAKNKAESSRRIFELLDNALQGRGAVSEAGAFASRRAAMAYVSSGGTDVDKLTSALGILNEPSEKFFGTFQDYARDFALTTNAIEQSRAVAEATMTADEKAVQILEQSLEQQRASEAAQIAAVEKLLAVNEQVLTVEEAMVQYLAAQATYEQVQAQHAELIAQFPMLKETFLSVADAIAGLQAAIAEQTAAELALAAAQEAVKKSEETSVDTSKADAILKELATLVIPEAVSVVASKYVSGILGIDKASWAELSTGERFSTKSGSGDQERLNAVALAQARADELNKEREAALARQATLNTQLDKLREEVIAAGGVPTFATGGMHIGGPRIVGENGPELEVTGPSRIYSNRDTASMFRDPNLASAVDGLRKEVSGMRSEQLQIQVEVSKNVKRIYDIERKWDTDGLPPERV